ncbi:Protein kinase-like domain superfamily [Sesbania bispinosa]|nr:Protein kinase-like domain superfamily [Sesbania bispinosa]
MTIKWGLLQHSFTPCNGLNKSCMAFLIFKSQPPLQYHPHNSNLTSSNLEELARIMVPLRSQDYYQADTKYILGPNPTYFTVANDTFQGLATCDSLKQANPYGELDLHPGMELHLPLRCACPTWNQTTKGTKNSFSIHTILIPLPSEPVSSTTIVANDPPAMSPTPVCSYKKWRSKRKLHIAVVTTGVSMLVLCVIICGVSDSAQRDQQGSLSEEQKVHGAPSWAKRIQIAMDIANGLEYLHNFTEPCYVHKGINSVKYSTKQRSQGQAANFALAEESERIITSGCPHHSCGIQGLYGSRVSGGRHSHNQKDVYALDGCFCELITGKNIYPARWKRVMLSNHSKSHW